jgi:hypothetical protein
MDDDFYSLASNATIASPGLLSSVLQSLVASPASILVTLLLFPALVVVATRLLSGRASAPIKGGNGRTVWLPPYWIPIVGHALHL